MTPKREQLLGLGTEKRYEKSSNAGGYWQYGPTTVERLYEDFINLHCGKAK